MPLLCGQEFGQGTACLCSVMSGPQVEKSLKAGVMKSTLLKSLTVGAGSQLRLDKIPTCGS